MRTVLLVLLTTILFTSLVNGVVLKLALIIVKVTGQITLTRVMCWRLYILATLIVIGLLWLFVRIGGR